MNRIKCGIMSLTRRPEGDELAAYLRWHVLDHLPEQFQLPGMLCATRWIADDACSAATLHATAAFDELNSVMQYLIGDPVQRTIDDFLELGPRLRELGRFPVRMPSVQLGAYALLHARASPRVLVADEVVPFRPHRGVVLIVEEVAQETSLEEWQMWLRTEHTDMLLAIDGCAGVWTFGTTQTWKVPPRLDVGRQFATIVYCDEDPVTITSTAEQIVRSRWASGAVRPRVAMPLRSMLRWDAWP